MRRLITPIIILVLFVGVEWVARRVDNTVPAPLLWDTQFTQDKATQIAGLGDRLDVVFVGSSVAQANLDPVFFTETSQQFTTAYNAGIPAVAPRVWREFLLDTVYRETCPAVVVIAVDIRQFNDNKPSGDGQLHRYLNSRGRLDALGSADGWQQAETWLESKSALFRIRSRLREPDKVVAWVWEIGTKGDWRNTNLSPLGRYVSNDARTFESSQEKLDLLADTAFRDFSVGGTETNAVRQMIEDAIEMGATPVLVEMPAMNEQLGTALPNGAEDLALYTSALRTVADEYGVAFIRFPELDDRSVFYADYYHMNLIGIETVTRSLAERIDELHLEVGTGICEEAGL